MEVRFKSSRFGVLSGLLIVFMLLLSGCATQTQSLLQAPPAGLPRHAELSETPFFPQERYQCGPATLAMALGAAGITVTPESLVSQVYVPQREGSLQPEMLAAGRRNGAFSIPIPPQLDALLQEVAAGNPVIVLQNLSLPWFPLWHYALVIGYDLDQREILMRSGTTKRLVMPMSTFEHTWARSGRWGMVALYAGRLPVTAEENQSVNALVAFEKANSPYRARNAYESALQRWPHNLTLQLGRGNAAYAAGDYRAAANAFREATRDHPESGAAFNNLASVLLELGALEQARTAAERAVALGGPWTEAALATLHSVREEQRKASIN